VDDEGSTLIETLVSLALIVTAMGAMGTYFVNSVLAVGAQRTTQTAAQVANTAIEQVRGLRGNSLAANHAKDQVDAQWAAGLQNSAVQGYLKDMDPAYDALAAVGSGPNAAISTDSQTVRSDGVNFTRTIYVGECYLYTGVPAGTTNSYSQQTDVSNNCQPHPQGCSSTPPADPLCQYVGGPQELQFYRAVVLISWSGRNCVGNSCNYVVSTLISRESEPTFDVHQPAPTVNTTPLEFYQNTAVSYQLIANFGQLPNAWAATNLPAGLSIVKTTPSTGYPIYTLSGTPTTTGTFTTPSFTVTDSLGRSDTQPIKITIWPPLTLTGLADTTGHVGDVISQAAKATGGDTSAAYTFSQTGLAGTGLTLNADGTITGTLTTPGTYPVTVKVADGNTNLNTQATKSITYTYRVYPAIALAPISDQTVNALAPMTVTAAGSGGDGTLTYSATGLPAGVTINSGTGVISGSPTVPGRYLPLVTVADGSGGTASARFAIEVDSTTGLTFTSPSLSAPDQADTVGKQANLKLSDNSNKLGLSPTLAVTGLPPGLTANPLNGNISGKPTTAGTYVVTATLTNLTPPQTAVLTFLWIIS
jgi:type II secretory pathway pseudopilin PulG